MDSVACALPLAGTVSGDEIVQVAFAGQAPAFTASETLPEKPLPEVTVTV